MSRRLLILLAIIATEIACLSGGILAAGWGVRRALVNNIASQALEDNRLIAKQFGRLIEEMDLNQIPLVSERWERLQNAVEGISLPNNGFVCVVDSRSGKLLCHPEMRQNPGMSEIATGLMAISANGDSIVSQVTPLKDAAGPVAMGEDDTQLVAARRLPRLNANVLVHQRLNDIKATAQERSQAVYGIGVPVSCMIIGFSALGCWLWMTFYDSRLEKKNASLEESLDQSNQSLTRTRNAVIFGLAKLAENRDSDTGQHLDRIREYSTLLSKKLQESHDEVNSAFIADIGLASALHDIGKVGIPDAVLLKPGKLTAEERKIIEAHPVIGCKCLLSIDKHLGDDNFLAMATEICLTHHEKWDGSGYPLGLSGEDVPLSARIVAVADVYDALTSKRPYKDAMPHEEAHQIIMDGAGTHFDPDIVAIFDVLFDEFKTIREKHSDTEDDTLPAESVKIFESLGVVGNRESLAALN